MASTPLAIQTPQPAGPLVSLGNLLGIKDQLSQLALRGAQTRQAEQAGANLQQEAALKTQEAQGTQRLEKLLGDPANQKAFASGDYSPIWNDGGVPVAVATKYISANENNLKDLNARHKSELENRAAEIGELQKFGGSIRELALKDPQAAADTYNQNFANFAKAAPGISQTLPQTLQGSPDLPAMIDSVLAGHGALLENINATLARKKTEQETATSAAQEGSARATAAETAAKTPGAVAASREQQLKTAAMEAALQPADPNAAHPVDQISGLSPDIASSYKALYDRAKQADLAGGDLKTPQANQVLKNAQDFAQEHSKQAIDADVNKAVRVAQGQRRPRSTKLCRRSWRRLA